MKLIQIVGARPQFVKAAAIYNATKPTSVKHLLLHTGQHFDREMSDDIIRELNLPKPDFNLGINRLSHGAMTGRMLEGIEAVLLREKPDWVIVHGDTNSTLAGALAAAKLGIPIAHVEAGLRSGLSSQPEEINRCLTDRISKVLFCPTKKAVDNLSVEGMPALGKHIFWVGDVMYDIWKQSKKYFQLPDMQLPEKYALLTLHRQENLDNPRHFEQLMAALHDLNDLIPLVFLIHPRTKQYLRDNEVSCRLLTLSPQSYLKTMGLLQAASLVLTDSGGLQKEAYWSEKKCLVLRNETEWSELLDTGMTTLALPLQKNLTDQAMDLLALPANFSTPLYGNGHAASEILKVLLSFDISTT